ncbi:MAG: hypothetical protein ABL879_13185 [Devosia sp.]
MTAEAIERAVYISAAVLRGQNVTVAVEDLVTLAEAGWPQAHIALCEKAERETEAGDTLSIDLQAYIVRRAKGHPPAVPRGRNRMANFARDATIAVTIRWLIKEGFYATRNEATDAQESACSVVAKALAANGGPHLSERAIEKIWERYQREDAEALH